MFGVNHHSSCRGGILNQAEQEVSVGRHKVLVKRPHLPLTQFMLAGLYDREIVQVPEL